MIGLQDLRCQLIQVAEVLNGLLLCQPAGHPQVDVLGVFRQYVLLLRVLQYGDAALQLLQKPRLVPHSFCSFRNRFTCC